MRRLAVRAFVCAQAFAGQCPLECHKVGRCDACFLHVAWGRFVWHRFAVATFAISDGVRG